MADKVIMMERRIAPDDQWEWILHDKRRIKRQGLYAIHRKHILNTIAWGVWLDMLSDDDWDELTKDVSMIIEKYKARRE